MDSFPLFVFFDTQKAIFRINLLEMTNFFE